jgi:hypothetical protein
MSLISKPGIASGESIVVVTHWEKRMVLTQYSMVCQAPGAEPYTICAYSGTDISQVVGITQAPVMPEGTYGWIQECGEAVVRVSSQTQPAYADFRPNDARLHLGEEPTGDSGGQSPEISHRVLYEKSRHQEKRERLSQLPPLLIEVGPYCSLLREARDVFVDGYFYACVAMCGISLERFQRDKAQPYLSTQEAKMPVVRSTLEKNKVLALETLALCEEMARLRNEYAHGHGVKPREDALKTLTWMHSFIDNETSLMRDYVVVEGILYRRCTKIP